MRNDLGIARRRGAFSLVEILVVVAVIGLIAAIAVPTIANITSTADEESAKRNAQSICALHNGARAAGIEFATGSESEIIDALMAGVSGGDVDGSEFKLSGLSVEEKAQAMLYCDFDSAHGLMIYYPDGAP